jgi:hypothetical protein
VLHISLHFNNDFSVQNNDSLAHKAFSLFVTVNLDENNKRGLATAMANIIANRSRQSNFQLVLM